MQQPDQDHVRARAHQIWEREGCPEGRHLEHWEMASAEITDEARPASLAKARARKAAKKAEPVAAAKPRRRASRKTAVAA